jgi:hypothetical protein
VDRTDEAMQKLLLGVLLPAQILTLILWVFRVLTFWQATIPAALVGLWVEFLVLKYFIAMIVSWREGENERANDTTKR